MSKFEILLDQAAQLQQRENKLAQTILTMQAQLDEVRNFRLDLIDAIDRQRAFDERQAASQAIKEAAKT